MADEITAECFPLESAIPEVDPPVPPSLDLSHSGTADTPGNGRGLPCRDRDPSHTRAEYRMAKPNAVETILQEVTGGNRAAKDRLFEVLYPELRALAERYMSQERVDHTLQATSLVHEAYLRLVAAPNLAWRDRVHFFAVASRAMRRVLVDHARGRRRAKRAGRHPHVPLDEALTISDADGGKDLVAIDLALTRLALEEPQKARVVEMRFFGGMTEAEIAEVLQVTPRTVRRYWAYAQARLYETMVDTKD